MPSNGKRGGYAAARKIVVSDPEVLGGRSVFRGTRVPIDVLFDNLADGMTIDEILSEYPTLDRGDVLDLLRGAAQALSLEKTV